MMPKEREVFHERITIYSFYSELNFSFSVLIRFKFNFIILISCSGGRGVCSMTPDLVYLRDSNCLTIPFGSNAHRYCCDRIIATYCGMRCPENDPWLCEMRCPGNSMAPDLRAFLDPLSYSFRICKGIYNVYENSCNRP